MVGHHVNIVLDYGANVSGRPHHWTDTGLTFGKYLLFFLKLFFLRKAISKENCLLVSFDVIYR